MEESFSVMVVRAATPNVQREAAGREAPSRVLGQENSSPVAQFLLKLWLSHLLSVPALYPCLYLRIS